LTSHRAQWARARSELGALAKCIVHGDFFTHDFGGQRFNVVYERTFLCALPVDLWPPYIQRTTQLLRPNGKLVGIFLYGQQTDPPPYPLSPETASALFRDKFSLIKTAPISDSLPLFAGKERWQEWLVA
jgi:hypothetical protein